MQGKDIPLLGYFFAKNKPEICTNITCMPLIVLANGVLNQSPLTTRERDVLNLWAKGFQRKKIAETLLLSPETVKKHLHNIYRKLDAHNKVQALTKAGYL